MVGQALKATGWESSSSCETTALIESDCWRCCCLRPSSRAARARPIFCREMRNGFRAPAGCSSKTSIEAPPLSPNKPVTADDLVSAEGYCPGMAPPGGNPADANAATDAAAAAPVPSTTGTVALGHTECDVVRGIGAPASVNLSNNRARRPGGGHHLFAGPARRNLHLHGRTPDFDRAWAGAGGAAEGRKIEGQEKTGGDLMVAARFRPARS